MSAPIWLLPQGISEILPNEAARFEQLRRMILDDLQAKSFQLVMPPMIEFLDNLIQGAGSELTTQTFKFPDYDSQKTLGIRADMTPQIAHIDANRLGANDINCLCYLGTVLRTKPMTLGGSRELFQIGAEIFGDSSIDADKQIIDAMISVHQIALANNANNKNSKPGNISLSLCHIGIFTALIETLDIEELLASRIYDALLRKSTPDIRELNSNSKEDLSAFFELSKARGGIEVLDNFMNNSAITKIFDKDSKFIKKIQSAISELSEISSHVSAYSEIDLHIDLSELHGYQYHTGLTFQTFIEGEGRALAKGGRYYGVSQSQEENRPATGFSADLKLLANLG